MKRFNISFVFIFFFVNFFIFNGSKAEKAHDLPSPKIFNLSEPNKFFTGRDQEIINIKLGLDKSNVIVVEGLSGIGKTQLAKKYAQSHLNIYDLIWWFNSEKNMEPQIDGLLKEIFRKENKPYYRPENVQELIKKLKLELATLKSSWLLVFDNVDDISLIHQYAPIKAPIKENDKFLQHVMMTSKKMNNTYPSLMIDKFQRKESVAFLAKILEEEKEEDLHLLAEALGDYPLALAQAASYIKMNPSIHVKTYLQLFKESYLVGPEILPNALD